jgi:hypothetical protein
MAEGEEIQFSELYFLYLSVSGSPKFYKWFIFTFPFFILLFSEFCNPVVKMLAWLPVMKLMSL